MTFFDYHIFFNSLKVMSTGTRLEIFMGKEVKPTKIQPNKFIVSKAYFAGKITHHFVSKTVSCFSETP